MAPAQFITLGIMLVFRGYRLSAFSYQPNCEKIYYLASTFGNH